MKLLFFFLMVKKCVLPSILSPDGWSYRILFHSLVKLDECPCLSLMTETPSSQDKEFLSSAWLCHFNG
ncbi:hypothetical protein A4A49_31259 [Nicotiana attenuata]|uniref:Uncharacterized protein n=1 Tax=Nicotiana attenuata TaxID=49451 RepID=A0A314LEW7_NICAT|nr:hypothetical protein A4A49_31259 [Nicotiana attenuata]